MLRSALAGLVGGALWGVAARVWMRLITTDSPEFSWSGTLAIVIASALAGVAMGLVRGARQQARSRWWRACAILALPIAIAPQGIVAFLPAFVLGGIALSGRLPRWVRLGLAAVTVAMPPLFAFYLLTPLDRLGLPLVTFLVGLYLLQAGQALGGSMLFRRWPERTEGPSHRHAAVGQPLEPSLR